MALIVPGFRLVRGPTSAPEPLLSRWYPIKAAGIARAVAPGMWWKKLTDGTVDVVAAADTTTAAANILGVGELFALDNQLNPAPYQYFQSGQTVGFVQIWLAGNNAVFEATEDSVGGPMSATGNAVGSVPLAVGALNPATISPGNISNQIVVGDLLDSSLLNSSMTANAFQIIGPTGDIANDGGALAGLNPPQWTYQIRLGSTFRSADIA